jgi:hypothetical protein
MNGGHGQETWKQQVVVVHLNGPLSFSCRNHIVTGTTSSGTGSQPRRAWRRRKSA